MIKQDHLDKRLDEILDLITDVKERQLLSERHKRLKGNDRLLSVKDIAYMTGLSARSVERDIKDGKIRCFQIHSKIRVRMEWVLTWLEKHVVNTPREQKLPKTEQNKVAKFQR